MTPHILGRKRAARRVRLAALLAAPVLVLSVLSTASGPEQAAASPTTTAPSGAGSAGSAANFASLPGDAKPVAVTLITGDTVMWADSGDGQPRLEIEQAPREVPVEFDQYGSAEDFYVIPSDAMPHVVDGTLDEELFNIPSLIRQGFDDKSTGGELPVIVTFDTERSPQRLERDANALPAASDAQAVEGIQGAGVTVDTDRAAQFRDAVLTKPGKQGRGPNTNSQSDSLAGAVDTILLDRMLELDLSESVPQIGAPAAWEAGFTGEGVTVAVLDTGIDTTHPDLEGQVVAAENFTTEPDTSDTHGHGTHVASTIAGTGVASDGVRRGVAPEADLISGKVCFSNEDGDGVCPTSAIMAGMEWAAAQGADVVNMSLGGGPTNGTDPLAQLLNELSAETGTLFVTSAGNLGCVPSIGRIQRVGSPAAADAALAVGAVDKSDQRASFSSCGPRVGDYAVKPEITAPGVGIVAARAEGTSAGSPVDDHYTSLSGTSMASPHVAGAAALLAQATGLSGGDLKDALVSTTVDGGLLWFQQGTGRVDVSSALDSPVYAQGTANFGGVKGHAERDLTYTNHSDDDVTLALDAAVTDTNGQALDVVSLSADTLTVPAGGKATVTVRLDITGVPGAGENLVGGGVVTATADGVSLRTGIGFGPIRHNLTIEVLDSHGDRIGTPSAPDWQVHIDHDTYDAARPVGDPDYSFATNGGIATGALPTGTYTLKASISEVDPDTGDPLRGSVLVATNVVIDADTTITLDARDAVPVQVTVPREADKRNHVVSLIRQPSRGPDAISVLQTSAGNRPMYVTPAPPTDVGFLALMVHWTLAEAQPVHALPWEKEGRCPRVPSACGSEAPAYVYNLPFVYENGIPGNLHETVTRRDLVEVPTRYHSDQPDDIYINHQFHAFTPFPCGFGGCGGQSTSMWIKPGEVTEYFLADDRITWVRFAQPYHPSEGTTPNKTFFQFNQASRELFLAAEAGTRRTEERWFEGPVRMGSADIREEYFHTTRDFGLTATAARGGADGNQFIPGYHIMDNTRGHYTAPQELLPSLASWRMWNLNTGTELEGVEFNPGATPGVPAFELTSEEAIYRLEQTGEYPEVGAEFFRIGPATTIWTFTSRPSDAEVPDGYGCAIVPGDVCQIQPLIQLEYDLDLDIHNQARAGRAHVFTINVGHHSKAIDRSKVTDLSVEASFDDGETWTDARVVGKATDTWDTGGFLPSSAPYQQYEVVLKIPPLHRTNGYVSLRVKAEDANGGTVEQEIHRAYILK